MSSLYVFFAALPWAAICQDCDLVGECDVSGQSVNFLQTGMMHKEQAFLNLGQGVIPSISESKSLQKAANTPTQGFQSLVQSLMIPGVQKGGTSTLRQLLGNIGGCGSSMEELHFFDYMKWAVMSVPPDELSSEYDRYFEHCGNVGGDFFTFEKSPASYVKPWIPMRIRELYPTQKVAMLLRNPTDRAYSGFWQCKPVLDTYIAAHAKSLISSATDGGFDTLAHLEIAIVEACGVPAGNGVFDHDWPLAVNFSVCCKAVAEKHGFVAWPGCLAYGHEQPEQFRNIANVTHSLQNIPQPKDKWSGGAFGDYCFDFVRQGIYIQHLQSWYTHLPARNILLIPGNMLVEDPGRTLHLLVSHTTSSTVDAQTNAKILNAIKVGYHANEQTAKHEGLTNYTRGLLDRFYSPFNRQLKMQYGVSV